MIALAMSAEHTPHANLAVDFAAVVGTISEVELAVVLSDTVAAVFVDCDLDPPVDPPYFFVPLLYHRIQTLPRSMPVKHN